MMMPVLRFFFFFLSPFQKLMRPASRVRIFEVDDIQFVRPGERGAEEAAEAGVVFDDGFVDEADAAVFADEFF